MKRFDDPMFEAFNKTFSDFQPEVPAGAYVGVRNKMKKGSFWAFSLTSLNVYTVSTLLFAALAFTIISSSNGDQVSANSLETIDRPEATLNKVQHHLIESQRAEAPLTKMELIEHSTSNSCALTPTKVQVQEQLSLNPIVPIRNEEIKNNDLAKDASVLTADFDNLVKGEQPVKPEEVGSAKELLESAQNGVKETKKIVLSSTTTK